MTVSEKVLVFPPKHLGQVQPREANICPVRRANCALKWSMEIILY